MSALDRLATVVRTVRLAGLVLVLAVVVAGSWAIRQQQLEIRTAPVVAHAAHLAKAAVTTGCANLTGPPYLVVLKPGDGVVLNVTATNAASWARVSVATTCFGHGPCRCLDTRLTGSQQTVQPDPSSGRVTPQLPVGQASP